MLVYQRVYIQATWLAAGCSSHTPETPHPLLATIRLFGKRAKKGATLDSPAGFFWDEFAFLKKLYFMVFPTCSNHL